MNFQGCFTVQLSRFFAVAFASAINIISNLFDVVNTFLIFFFVSLSRQQILSYQIHSILSILFFIFFKKVFLAFVTMQRINFHAYHPPTDKRRRRDLNPRAAINDLLPFQGSPFSHLGTSPAEFIKCIQFIELLLETEKVGFEPTAPFGVTGFQDRLLKPLGHLSKRCLNSIPKIQVLVNNFFLFLHQNILSLDPNRAPPTPQMSIFSLVKGEKRTRSVRNANVEEGRPE